METDIKNISITIEEYTKLIKKNTELEVLLENIKEKRKEYKKPQLSKMDKHLGLDEYIRDCMNYSTGLQSGSNVDDIRIKYDGYSFEYYKWLDDQIGLLLKKTQGLEEQFEK